MANLKEKTYDTINGVTTYKFKDGETIDIFKRDEGDEPNAFFYEAWYDDDADTFFSGTILLDEENDVIDFDGCYELSNNFFEVFDDLGLTHKTL
jgi:hypothetical protein